MDAKIAYILLLIIVPVFLEPLRPTREERLIQQRFREARRGVHYHNKRHMMPSDVNEIKDSKKRPTTQKNRDMRKKPTGHLAPLDEDDMENDEVVSVAIGPPPFRAKYDKPWKSPQPNKTITTPNPNLTSVTNIVRDVLTQLGQEFMMKQVNEDFVFGQYIGNSMSNLTKDLKLRMQHEILDIVVKYQKLNQGDSPKEMKNNQDVDIKKPDVRKYGPNHNETEENWPDFTNLERIVG